MSPFPTIPDPQASAEMSVAPPAAIFDASAYWFAHDDSFAVAVRVGLFPDWDRKLRRHFKARARKAKVPPRWTATQVLRELDRRRGHGGDGAG